MALRGMLYNGTVLMSNNGEILLCEGSADSWNLAFGSSTYGYGYDITIDQTWTVTTGTVNVLSPTVYRKIDNDTDHFLMDRYVGTFREGSATVFDVPALIGTTYEGNPYDFSQWWQRYLIQMYLKESTMEILWRGYYQLRCRNYFDNGLGGKSEYFGPDVKANVEKTCNGEWSAEGTYDITSYDSNNFTQNGVTITPTDEQLELVRVP